MTEDQLQEIQDRANEAFEIPYDAAPLQCVHGRDPWERCEICTGEDSMMLVNEVKRLRGEVKKYRQLLLEAYDLGVTATAKAVDAHPDSNGHCLWCYYDATGYGPTHTDYCPVFTPYGALK